MTLLQHTTVINALKEYLCNKRCGTADTAQQCLLQESRIIKI